MLPEHCLKGGSLGGAFMRPDGLSMFRGASETSGSSLRRWRPHSLIFQLTKLRRAAPQRLRDGAMHRGRENGWLRGCLSDWRILAPRSFWSFEEPKMR